MSNARTLSQLPAIGVAAIGALDQAGINRTGQTLFDSLADRDPIRLSDMADEAIVQAVFRGDVAVNDLLATALAAAADQNRSIIFPERRTLEWADNATLDIPAVPIDFNGCTIRQNGYGALLRSKAADPDIDGGLLAADVAIGADMVTMQSGENDGIVTGMLCVLLSKKRIFTGAGGYQAEPVMIRKIEGDAFSFFGATLYAHAVADGARLMPLDPRLRSGLVMRNGTFRMDKSVDVSLHSLNQGMILWDLKFALLDNMGWEDLLSPALDIQNCAFMRVINPRFNIGGSTTTGDANPVPGEYLPGFSYGFMQRGLNFANRLTGGQAVSVRHHDSTVSPTIAAGTKLTEFGEPIGTVVEDCTHSFAANMAFDEHEAGLFGAHINCVAIKPRYAGLQVRSRNHVVRNLMVIGAIGPALWIRGGNTGGTHGDYCDVDGVNAVNCNQGVTFDSTDWREYAAVMDEGSYTRGRHLRTRSCGGGALYLYRNGGNAYGDWDDIDDIDGCQLAATSKSAVTIGALLGVGKVEIGRVRVKSDGKVVDILKSNAGGTAVIVARDIDGSGYTGLKINKAGVAPIVSEVAMTKLTVERPDGHGAVLQKIDIYTDSSFHHVMRAVSSSTDVPKSGFVEIRATDAVAAPTSGTMRFGVFVGGIEGIGSDHLGNVLQANSVIYGADRIGRKRAYTASTVPTPGTAGRGDIWVSNGAAINPMTGAMQGSGAGVAANDDGAGWKLPGTDVAVSTGGTRRKLPYILVQSHVALSLTGTTAKTTYATIVLPAGAVGPNGKVEVELMVSHTGGNPVTVTAELAGNPFFNVANSSALFWAAVGRFFNRASQSSQLTQPANLTSYGVSTSGLVTFNVDTSLAQSITLTGQLGTAGDVLTIESYTIKIFPGD